MPLYDLMLLLDPTAPSDRHEAILKEVTGMLESSGTIRGDYDWGTRRMAFEIDHRPEAAYHLVQFETAPGGELLARIDHTLKIMDGVLRHRIIRLKDGSPPPPVPRPEGRRDYESAPEPEAGVTNGAPAEAGEPEAPADTAAVETPAVETPAVEAPTIETATIEPAAPSPEPEAPEPEDAPDDAAPAEEPAPDDPAA